MIGRVENVEDDVITIISNKKTYIGFVSHLKSKNIEVGKIISFTPSEIDFCNKKLLLAKDIKLEKDYSLKREN